MGQKVVESDSSIGGHFVWIPDCKQVCYEHVHKRLELFVFRRRKSSVVSAERLEISSLPLTQNKPARECGLARAIHCQLTLRRKKNTVGWVLIQEARQRGSGNRMHKFRTPKPALRNTELYSHDSISPMGQCKTKKYPPVCASVA